MYAYEGATILSDRLGELYAFPKATHDDQVDALAQGVRYLTTYSNGTGWFVDMRWEIEATNDRRRLEGISD